MAGWLWSADNGHRFDGDSGLWAGLEGDIATVGLSDHAQKQFGEIGSIELPAIDTELTQGGRAASIQTIKEGGGREPPVDEEAHGPGWSHSKHSEGGEEWASKVQTDLVSPVSGTVVAVNEELASKPSLVRSPLPLQALLGTKALTSSGGGVQVNSDPEGAGWILKVRVAEPAQFEQLLTRGVYSKALA